MHVAAIGGSLLLGVMAGEQEAVTAFVDVTLIPMDRPGAVAHQTVVVRGERIESVGAAASLAIPPDARRIAGAGRFLMPGLIDDHVHLIDERDLLLYVANGVTTVRNLKGSPFHLEVREAVRSGELLGPRFLTSGPFLNEPYFKTPDEFEAAAHAQADAGYDCLKIHGRVGLEAFERLCDVGEEVGLPIVGHVPRNLRLADVLEVGGLVEISHAEEILYTHFDPLGRSFDLREIPAAVALVKQSGARVTPTLVAYGGIAPQIEDLERVLARPEVSYLTPLARRMFARDLNEYVGRFDADDVALLRRSREFQGRLVKALHESGVPILLGTDAMIPVVVPGFSVLDELANLVGAGLSTWDALAAATVRPGEFLGGSPLLGRVVPGAAADLLLLEADPLSNVRNVARRAGVMANGRWLEQSELDSMLERHVASFAVEEELVKGLRLDSAAGLLAAVRALPKNEDGTGVLSESFLSSVGIAYTWAHVPPLAVEVFAANLELHPGSPRAQRRLVEAKALASR